MTRVARFDSAARYQLTGQNARKEMVMKSTAKKKAVKSGQALKPTGGLNVWDLSAIGDISRFSKTADGWVRWNLIQRDFAATAKDCMTFAKATEHCAIQGGRLGTRLEQFLLFCAMKANPGIKSQFFPDTKESWYWTEEDYYNDSNYAYVVGFYDGSVSSIHLDYSYYVRPVRASQRL